MRKRATPRTEPPALAPVPCLYCPRLFGDRNAARQHMKVKHGATAVERSIASLLVEAELQRAMGGPVENDWLLDMLP